jgi:hypothetical protein
MDRIILVALIAIPALVGCSGESVEAGNTPDETLEALSAAIDQKDWNALYELTPPSERTEYESAWANQEGHFPVALKRLAEILESDRAEVAGRNFAEIFHALMEKCSNNELPVLCFLSHAILTPGEVEGVRCRVICSCEKKCKTRLVLRRERGSWYVGGLLTRVQTVALAKK